jgi:hypothetical protein
MHDETPHHGEASPEQAEDAPEDHPGEPGAAGGSENADAKVPFQPQKDDDSALGDTDQHSDA